MHLPVTTELACLCGIEMANYPEFLADIRFSKEENWISCKADFDGKNILSLSGKNIPVRPFPRQRVFPVTRKDDQLLRSEFNFNNAEVGVSKKQFDVKLEFGDHPIGQKLKDIYAGRVLQYQYYPSGQAILSSPTESYTILN